MKKKLPVSAIDAFSLVEVVVAIGIAAFCLVAIFGLLPIGLNSNSNASQQTAATGLASGVIADLRTAGSGSTAQSLRYKLKPGANATANLFLMEDGSVATTNQPRYRATVITMPPTGSNRTATMARVLVTWPVVASSTSSIMPTNYLGSFETVIGLDRN